MQEGKMHWLVALMERMSIWEELWYNKERLLCAKMPANGSGLQN